MKTSGTRAANAILCFSVPSGERDSTHTIFAEKATKLDDVFADLHVGEALTTLFSVHVHVDSVGEF